MPGISSKLYNRCRTTFLKCSEFDDTKSLRTIFVTVELAPFRSRLPEATNKSGRVSATLDYLLSERLSDGRPVLPLFLAALRDRYQKGNALHDELEVLRINFQNLASTSSIYKAAKRRRSLAEFGRVKLALVLLALLVVTVACSLLCVWSVTWLTRDDTRIYNVQIRGQNDNVIVAYNQKGNSIWQVELDSKVRDVILDDIDQDGRQEVIAATQEPGARPGWLLVFDEKRQLIGEHNTWRPTIYSGAFSDQFNIVDFLIADLTGDGTKEIVTVSQDVYWYVSRVTVFRFQDRQFQEMSGYWNPGLLNTLDAADIDRDGIQEIVCVGENNDLQAIYPIEGNMPVVLALEGSNISGQAPPYFGNAPQGAELWYAYTPPPNGRVVEVGFVDINGDGVDEFHITLAKNCSRYLDSRGNVVERGLGTGCTDDVELIILQTDK